MATATWEIDHTHSDVGFTVRHLVVSKVRGHFTSWNATLRVDIDNLTTSSVDVEIDAASIDTREPKRDGHLRSPDFLDAEAHPKLTFKSKKVEKNGDGLRVTGDLTIRGETHEAILDAEYNGLAKDPWGNTKIGFSAHTKIDRKTWGLKWNQALETGGILVGDTVDIHIDIEAKQTA